MISGEGLGMCGHALDDLDPRPALHGEYSWMISAIQRVKIDHVDHWRVTALVRLHAHSSYSAACRARRSSLFPSRCACSLAVH